MKWDVMDIREMSYRDESFDIIIDKSTIDALLCGNLAYLNVAFMMKECQRVLKTGGTYVAVSYGAPENRELHLARPNLSFDIRIYKIERAAQQNPDPMGAKAQPTVHYVYVCTKKEDANQKHVENYAKVLQEISAELEDEEDSDCEQEDNPLQAPPIKPTQKAQA